MGIKAYRALGAGEPVRYRASQSTYPLRRVGWVCQLTVDLPSAPGRLGVGADLQASQRLRACKLRGGAL